MTEKLKQQLKEQMEFIPKESQEVIDAFDWVKISEEIGKKYYLDENDINMLQAEIGLTLTGLQEQDTLATNIEDDIVVSKNHAEKITEEIIQKILKPILDELTKNVKSNLKNKNTHWQQNLNFVLSGGDYTAFIREPEPEAKAEINPNTNNMGTFNHSKVDDLKSKFTI